MKKITKKVLSVFLGALLFGTMAAPRAAMAAEASVKTGTTKNFAILSGETITNTGSTIITGDIGLYSGTAFTEQAQVTHNGELHLTDAVALTAKNDLITAYDDAASRTPKVIDSQLDGQTLYPGVYSSADGKFQLAVDGKLTLDGLDDPNAVFIFQTASTLDTEAGSNVVLENGATPCGVFWQVGSSATLGTNSTFVGRILAMTSISLKTGADVRGQLLARNGSVTLDSNEIISGPCRETLSATLNVIKLVVNKDGKTSVAGDFSVRVLTDGIDVEGSPSAGMDTPGKPYTLSAGNYEVTEVPVEGYAASFSGDSTDGKITLAPGDVKTITITNTSVNNGIIEVDKVDVNGNLLPGAEFTLYKGDNVVGEPRVTEADGKIVFNGLPKGDYILKETKAPAGYVLSDKVTEISIIDDKPVEISVKNTKMMGTVNITKVDADTGAVLAGAGFVITDHAGSEVFEGNTDDKGMIIVMLPYGEYVIEEVTAPKNYIKADDKYSVDITEDSQVFNVEVKNTKAAAVKNTATPILPKAGNTSGMIFMIMGGFAITGGVLMLKKKRLA